MEVKTETNESWIMYFDEFEWFFSNYIVGHIKHADPLEGMPLRNDQVRNKTFFFLFIHMIFSINLPICFWLSLNKQNKIKQKTEKSGISKTTLMQNFNFPINFIRWSNPSSDLVVRFWCLKRFLGQTVSQSCLKRFLGRFWCSKRLRVH